MSQTLPAKRPVASARFRGVITTLLVIGLAVMIVRDILVRRWGAAPPPDAVTRPQGLREPGETP